MESSGRGGVTPPQHVPCGPSVETGRHEAAVLLLANARTPAEQAYYRGYVSGLSRRLAGGIDPNEPETVAMELLVDAPDGLDQLLARGYRDGVEGRIMVVPGRGDKDGCGSR